jgi:hypothetical protein
LTAPAGSLVARFHAAAPAPNTLEERQILVRVLRIVAAVERVLAALSDLASRLRRHSEHRDRRMAAKLDADYQLDGCRAQRASAKEKLEQWEANHRWKVATSSKDEVELKTQQANATDQLGAALATLAELNQAKIEPLISVAQGDEC